MLSTKEEAAIVREWGKMDLEEKTKLCIVATRCQMHYAAHGVTSVTRRLFRENGRGHVSDSLLEKYARIGLLILTETEVDFTTIEKLDLILELRNDVPCPLFVNREYLSHPAKTPHITKKTQAI